MASCVQGSHFKKKYIVFMAKYIVGACFLFFAVTADGQHSKKAEKRYVRAMALLEDAAYRDAIVLLKDVLHESPRYMEAQLSMGGVYSELKQYDSSVYYYEAARQLDGEKFQNYNLPYSIALAGVGRFADAENAIDRFLQQPNLYDVSLNSATYRKRCYEFALDYQRKHPDQTYKFEPVNLGNNINSMYSEYYPSLTYNDSILVYTRRGEGLREDFMQSMRRGDGSYSPAQPLRGMINERPSKGALNISQDGEWLLFAGNFPGRGIGDFDLYIAYNSSEGWSDPVNLGPEINTEFWESSPSLSADKSALYFSSNRPDGYGGSDLYVSYQQPNGRFGEAINLGPLINTKGDEMAPCIHADNHSLYFTSSGLPGYGGTDLFVSRKDAQGNWAVPENMGYPINTIDNEGSLFISADGSSAFYASDREDSRGFLDLYRFELRKDLRPIRTVFISGQVQDADTHQGIGATIEVSENNHQKLLNKMHTDPVGYYLITLPANDNYTVTINSKGYLFQSDVYNLTTKEQGNITRDVLLQKIKLNASRTLKNIQFPFKSYQLEAVSLIELDKVLQLLQENPTLHLQINGHTDNAGTAAINQPLSTHRAKAVVDYLVSKGIDSSRLAYKGFGATQPVASNDNDDGRVANRRTEILVIGM